MSGNEPAHNFTSYANEEKYKVSSQDHQTADVVQHDKRQNMFFIKPLKEHNNSSITKHVMLDIPNMFGSWPFLTAAEKVISVYHVFHKSLLLSLTGTQQARG